MHTLVEPVIEMKDSTMNTISVKKIIYIDGDTKYRQRARSAFAGQTYRCILAKDGLEGLNKIQQEKPDAVVVDYFLPDIAGEEVYTRYLMLRHSAEMEDIPFILLTENGKINRQQMYNLGFTACLGKPFNNSELYEFVEDAIVSHELKLKEIHFWDTIREAKDFLEKVVESSVDAIVTTDKKGMITFCNRAGENIFGYPFEEIVNRRISDFLERGATELLELNTLLNKRRKIVNYKTKVINKKGDLVPINVSISLMRSGDGEVMGVLAIAKSRTEGEDNEFTANDSEKMTAVIETAVAVNHAINNPLVPILGNAQFLLQDDTLNDEVRSRLRVIVKNALRIRDITQKLACIKNPVTKEYLKGTRMLDIDASAN